MVWQRRLFAVSHFRAILKAGLKSMDYHLLQPQASFIAMDCTGEHGNGYAFDGTDAGSLNSALDRAFAAYKDDKAQWSSLVADNMRRDCSWQSSAGQYLEMYYEELD